MIADNEARERQLLLGKFRNLEHELDGAKENLDEETSSLANLQRTLNKAEGESQMWRQKYETEAIAKAEELEMTKMKLQARLAETENTINNPSFLRWKSPRLRFKRNLMNSPLDWTRLKCSSTPWRRGQSSLTRLSMNGSRRWTVFPVT